MKIFLFVACILSIGASSATAQLVPAYHLDATVIQDGAIILTWEWGPVDGLYDDFEDNIAQDFQFWTPKYVPSPNRGAYFISNGYVELQSGWGDQFASAVYSAIEFTNFTLEAQIRNTGLDSGNNRGVLFRSDGPRDDDCNCYHFTFGYLYGSNEYAVWRLINGNAMPIINWTETAALNSGDDAINILKIVAIGSTFEFYINDIFVDTMTSNTFNSGFVGFVQAEGQIARYDYISCTYGTELQDRSVQPQRGERLTAWLDEAGRPMDHPPVMATEIEERQDKGDLLHFVQNDTPSSQSRQTKELNELNELDDFVEYRIYRDGVFIGATADTVFTDQLPSYGTYEYRVTAVYDPEGESIPSVAEVVNWNAVTYALEPVNHVVPYTGGTITYEALLFSELNQPFQNVVYRSYVTMPDQTIIGPTFQRSFTLGPNAYIHIPSVPVQVPANAPPGNYFLTGKLFYQGAPAMEQTFQFDKGGGGE